MYEVGQEFFIIGDNNKIEKYSINGFYTHTNKEETKKYYVYQKGDTVMTIGENFMYETLELCKEKALKDIEAEYLKLEQIKKDILETNI